MKTPTLIDVVEAIRPVVLVVKSAWQYVFGPPPPKPED